MKPRKPASSTTPAVALIANRAAMTVTRGQAEKSTGALKASCGTFASLVIVAASPSVLKIPRAPAMSAQIHTLPGTGPPRRSRRRISAVRFGHPRPLRYHQNNQSQIAVTTRSQGGEGRCADLRQWPALGGTPPIDTTSSPTMIARKITGRLRQRRTTKMGRRSGWIGLEFSTMGQIAVRYADSDSVLMLCKLCGKNMPALAERLHFPELSIAGLSGCDVHGPTGRSTAWKFIRG